MSEKVDVADKRIKKLEEQIAKKKAELVRAKGRLSETQRKARIKRFIQIGELAELAGVISYDDGFLLGYLVEAAAVEEASRQWKDYKTTGDSMLSKKKIGNA